MEAEDEQPKTRGRFGSTGCDYLHNPPPPHPPQPCIPSSDKSNNNVSGNFSLCLQNSFSLKKRRDGIRQRWNYNKGPEQTDSWSSVVPSLCILTTVRDINDNLEGWLPLFSSSSLPPPPLLISLYSKPNYCDFNHTVYE